MKKKLTKIVVLMIFILSMTTVNAQKNKVIVGIRGDKKPFSYVDEDGVLKGFEHELILAICKEASLKCNMKILTWEMLFFEVDKNFINIAFSSVSKTKKRQEALLFTDIYMPSPARILKKKTLNIQLTKEAVLGRNIGVLKNTTHDDFVKDQFEGVLDIIEYENSKELFEAIKNGDVDFIMNDEHFLQEGFLKTEGGKVFEFIGPKFNASDLFGDGIAAVVSEKSKDLIPKLNEGLKKIRAKGIYQKISRKYFGLDIFLSK